MGGKAVTKAVELCEECSKEPESCWCYYSASDDDRPRYYWACAKCHMSLEQCRCSEEERRE